MTYFIIGAVCFCAGALFGVFWMAVLSLAKQADENLPVQNADISVVNSDGNRGENFADPIL